MLKYLFEIMIKCYPPRFKQQFADEIKAVFEESLDEAESRGHMAVLGVWLRELRDFPLALMRAHAQEKDFLMAILASLYAGVRVLLLVLIVPFVVASICNFAQWNYVFSPPSLSPLVTEFAVIDSLSFYDLNPAETALGYDAVNGNANYGLSGNTDIARVGQWAQTEGVTTISRLNEHWLSALPDLMNDAGWTVEFLMSRDNIPYWTPMGFVAQGRALNGDPLVLISMVRVISDDHYGYHEGLFRQDASGYNLIRSNEYRYDNAGIEFAQWDFWFLVTLLLWGPLVLVAHSLQHKRHPQKTDYRLKAK